MSDTLAPAPPVQTVRPTWRTRLNRWDHKGSPYAFIAPFFILFGIFGAFPLIYTFWVSLHAWPLLGEHTFTGLENYRNLLQDPQFWNAAKNTLGIFVVSTVPQFALALWLAVTLNRKIRARTLFRIGVIIPNVTSVAAVTLIFSMIFAKSFGLVNWILGGFGVSAIDWAAHTWSSWLAISLMVDWRWTGYNALIFLAAMQAISKELYEAAEIDGASRTRQFWSVTLPMLRPTLIFTSITAIIGGVQLFTEPLLFAPGAGAIQGGTLRQFQTLTMYLIENGFTRFEFGYAGAVAAMIFMLVLIISLINIWLVRRFVGSD